MFLQIMDMATHVVLFHQVFGTVMALFLCVIRLSLKSFVYCIYEIPKNKCTQLNITGIIYIYKIYAVGR